MLLTLTLTLTSDAEADQGALIATVDFEADQVEGQTVGAFCERYLYPALMNLVPSLRLDVGRVTTPRHWRT